MSIEFLEENNLTDLLSIPTDEEKDKLEKIAELEEIFGDEAIEVLEEQCERESNIKEELRGFMFCLEGVSCENDKEENIKEGILYELENIIESESYSDLIFKLSSLQEAFKNKSIKLMGIKDKIELRDNLHSIYWDEDYEIGSVYQYGMICCFCKNKQLKENQILELKGVLNIEKIYNDTYINIKKILELFNSYKNKGYYYYFVDLHKKYQELWTLIESPDTFNQTVYNDKCIDLYLYLQNYANELLYIDKPNPRESNNAEVLVPAFKARLKDMFSKL